MWVGTCIVCGESTMLPTCTKTKKCEEITTLIEKLENRITDLNRNVSHVHDAIKDFEHDFLLYNKVRKESLDNLWNTLKPEGDCDRTKFLSKQLKYQMATTAARNLFRLKRFNNTPQALSNKLTELLTRLKSVDEAEGWKVNYTLTPEQVIADDRTTS